VQVNIGIAIHRQKELRTTILWLKNVQALGEETIVDTPVRKAVTRYVPLGVVGSITSQLRTS
jgi:acyl-CoA reductase-like NAD-dependent aldehyde dehydrogenase